MEGAGEAKWVSKEGEFIIRSFPGVPGNTAELTSYLCIAWPQQLIDQKLARHYLSSPLYEITHVILLLLTEGIDNW